MRTRSEVRRAHHRGHGLLIATGYEQVVSNSALDPATNPAAELVLDARPKGRYVLPLIHAPILSISHRFLGLDSEPRPGLSSGHIPHSLSIPFHAFLKKHTSKDGTEYTTLLSPPELRKALDDTVGAERADLVTKGKVPVVTSCGSGMTAGILWLGLKLLGVNNISIYDEVSVILTIAIVQVPINVYN